MDEECFSQIVHFEHFRHPEMDPVNRSDTFFCVIQFSSVSWRTKNSYRERIYRSMIKKELISSPVVQATKKTDSANYLVREFCKKKVTKVFAWLACPYR